MTSHYQKLQNLFLNSRINKTLDAQIKIGEGISEISFSKKEFMHNEVKEIHSAYCHMALDSSAYFAANSLIEDVSTMVKSFEIIHVRPSKSKKFIAKGKFLEKSMGNYIISSELFDDDENLICKAKGVFRRSKNSLKEINNYE
tara:strand:+ start:36 stop:464 length:429 start_codon:yes stop_codon:yes gene_type:complete